MIPVLRSIDHLLNRFDELSKCHTNFLMDFQTHFSEIENPLRQVNRSEEEQQKTAANLLTVVDETPEQQSSTGTIEDFHRRLIKTRFLHHPPSYTSHTVSAVSWVPSRSSSVTSSSTLHSPVTPVKLTTKPKPSVVQRNERSPITVFTLETVNRLSKPKASPKPAPIQTDHLMRKEAREGPPVKRVKSDNHTSSPLVVQSFTPTVNLARQSPRCFRPSKRILPSRRSMLYFKPSY